MSDGRCPFCDPDPDQVFFETELVVGLWDRYPVSPGHALLIPRRHVADWFEADPATQLALPSALPMARETIRKPYDLSGFNIDIGPMVAEKMKLNAEKYPADLAQGTVLKYSKLK